MKHHTASIQSLLITGVRRQPVGFTLLSIIMLIEVGLSILAPWPMKVLIDNAIGKQPVPTQISGLMSHLRSADSPDGLLIWCCVATVLLFGLSAMLGLVQSLISLNVGQKLMYGLASDVLAHLQRLSLKFHSRNPIGDSIRRISSDCGSITTILRDCGLPMIASVLTLISTFIVAAQLSLSLAVITLLTLPFLILILRKFSEPIADTSYEYAEQESSAYEHVERSLATVTLTQTFAREADQDRTLHTIYNSALSSALKSNIAHQKLSLLTGLVTAIATALIIYLGAIQVLHGTLTVGSLWVMLAYIAAIYSPLESLVDSSSHVRDAIGSARRVLEILNQSQDVHESLHARQLVQSNPGKGLGISIENIHFSYDPNQLVLNDLTLTVSPGEVIALVGPSGGGKSTLMSMLPRLFDPSHGKIVIDGQDIKDLTLASLRENIGIVLQQPFLFPMSIADNIAYGKPNATRDMIESAAKTAGAHEFISQLDGGYDAHVGERGATLSGGQRQRIAIARAILKNAPLLLLDEPTSALDAETEQAVVEGVRALLKGRTVVLIAHRLSTVRIATRIVVIDKGKIVEQGNHEQLMAMNGVYSRYHRIQFQPESNHE